MTDRLPCSVPGCGRSTPRAGRFADSAEWICARHWSLVGRDMRRAWNRVRRLQRKRGMEWRPEAALRLWRRIVRAASA